MTLPAGYSIRPATRADAGTLAHFRAAMFGDFGIEPEEGWEAFWTEYFQQALDDGRYWAVLAVQSAQAVACAGLMFLSVVPVPSDPSGIRAQVQGVYTLPGHRELGLGAALTHEVLREAQARGLKSATLNASEMGAGLYHRLGFTPAKAPELRLSLVGAVL
ncbi:GNAT family N-acetyltransferase [Deinococcus radiomollis]|uniref:GNAT family N-acetyltransferase n=1 Tax=Deinococcus radiomollis TaxID=468916 RepID=UPI00389139BC